MAGWAGLEASGAETRVIQMRLKLEHCQPVSAAEMRELDRRAIEEYGVPGAVLMENAGRGAAEVAMRMLEGLEAKSPVVVVCGKGNNGGDGYVVARHLHNHGYGVEIFLTHAPGEIRGDARTHLEVVLKMKGVPVRVASQPDSRRSLPECLRRASLVVDGLLGTGLERTVASPFDAFIGLANASGKPVLSLDIPSGLSSDTGEIMGCCIRATVTATFGLPKRGLLAGKGPQVAGELVLVDIGMPLDLLEPYLDPRP
jgi:NAD(P)H-hydrate epimerase